MISSSINDTFDQLSDAYRYQIFAENIESQVTKQSALSKIMVQTILILNNQVWKVLH